MTEKITASEAVYGFAAWLTTRDEPVTFGSSHDSAGPAELVKQYTEHNGMEPPRDGIWPDNVSMPNVSNEPF